MKGRSSATLMGLSPAPASAWLVAAARSRCGVDERAVEIEDDGSIAQLHICGAWV